jgi:hypothetical protein
VVVVQSRRGGSRSPLARSESEGASFCGTFLLLWLWFRRLCQETTLAANVVSFATALDQDGDTARDGFQLRVATVGILFTRGRAVS